MSTLVQKWKPIESRPTELSWRGPDLNALRNAWRKHRENLKHKSAIESFNQRLAREWAIETGIIERVYTIDRGTTQLLIEKGLDASLIEHGTTDRPPDQIIEILEDHRDALEGIFDFVAKRRELSISYIKELHQVLTRHQPTVGVKDQFGKWHDKEMIRGDWKRVPNNPTRVDGVIHEYCPPEHVQSEMERLVSMLNSPEFPFEGDDAVRDATALVEEAAWLHHRFTQIHPFEDGNGRMARTLSTLVMIRGEGFPVTVRREERSEYLQALETADAGDLAPLVEYFAKGQARSFYKALELSDRAEIEMRRQIISDAMSRLAEAKAVDPTRVAKIQAAVTPLEDLASQLFRDMKQELSPQLAKVNAEFVVKVRGGPKSPVLNRDIENIETAQHLSRERGWDISRFEYYRSVELSIVDIHENCIVVLLHGLSESASELRGASAIFIARSAQHPGHFDYLIGRKLLHEEPFRYHIDEDTTSTRERFKLWLDPVLTTGLAIWRQLVSKVRPDDSI